MAEEDPGKRSWKSYTGGTVEGMKRPDGTPVTVGSHRRLERTGILWRVIGTILVVVILVVVIYLYFHRPVR